MTSNLISAVSAIRLEKRLYSSSNIYHMLLLLLIALPALTLNLDGYPPIWFDEGYKTNAVRTLAERGVYGTYTTAGYIPFDPGISSGPADVIPLAFGYKFLGQGVAHLRLVIVLYTLLALASFYAIAAYLYGPGAGLFASLVMLAVPAIQGVSFLLIGRQILGEAPALALILLSLWFWFYSWENGRWSFVLAAGLCLGLGLLSKTQIAIALVPALLLVVLGRIIVKPSEWAKFTAYIVAMLAVIGVWTALGRLGASEAIRQENSLMLMDAIRSNLLTGLFGRTLTGSALVILAFMSLGVAASLWRLKGQLRQARSATHKAWAELTLILFVLASAIWFAFLSVGWPRYAYAALVIGLLLVGKLGWDIFEWVRPRLEQRWPALSRWTWPIALAGLALVALAANTYPVLQSNQENTAQQMADYISSTVPRNAVIETWEWELDALSQHWEYHHPHQRYLFLSIRQFSHEQKPFDLNYDLLQANPDYLVTGPFSDWTHLYDSNIITLNFVELKQIGAYRIYQRNY